MAWLPVTYLKKSLAGERAVIVEKEEERGPREYGFLAMELTCLFLCGCVISAGRWVMLMRS